MLLEYFVRKKLDGVGPVDNRPLFKLIHHFVKINIYIYMYINMTLDT